MCTSKTKKQNQKKNFSITISENIVQQFNENIGYGSRSKAIENLILKYLKKRKKSNPRRTYSNPKIKGDYNYE